jgi:hypothetical protein
LIAGAASVAVPLALSVTSGNLLLSDLINQHYN